MARTINQTGTGLQLWQVSRLYVELYANWPLGSPSEVWTSEVMEYNLPRTRLGGCGEASLTVATEPGRLPAGFTATTNPGQPVRSNLEAQGRLVRVIAVLPNGDEIVIYTGALGKMQATQPRLWQINLIGPDQLRMQEFVDAAAGGAWTQETANGWIWSASGAAMPTPAGRPPIAASARIYGPGGSIGQTSNYYNVPPDAATPLTTLEQWWRAALQNDPMAETCVGPDLVFGAGTPLGTTATRATYELDNRAYNLASAGRETPPYLTHVRGWVAGAPIQNHTGVSAGAFRPSRTATYGGSSKTEVVSKTGSMGQGSSSTISLQFGDVPGRLQGASIIVTLMITGITGTVHAGVNIQGQGTGLPVLWEQKWIALNGQYTIKVDLDQAALGTEAGSGFYVNAYLDLISTGATGNLSASATGSYRYEYDAFSYAYDAVPPGLNYPTMTDEGWTFSLPGIHAGPLYVTGLPGNLSQYAATVIRAEGQKLWTEVRTGPLPYAASPVSQSGRWVG